MIPDPVPLSAALAYAVVAISLPLNWYLAYKLWRLSLEDRSIRTLRERAITGLHIAIVVTVFAIVFLNNGMLDPFLTPGQTMIVTRLAILSLSIPPVRWLLIYYSDRR